MKLVIHNKGRGFLHNNACLHFVTVATEALGQLKYKLLPKLPQTQGLAQSDCHMFGQLTETLHEQIFASDNGYKDAVNTWPRSEPKNFLCRWGQKACESLCTMH
jgi:hypothetical protein